MQPLINFLSSVFYLPILLAFICGLFVMRSCNTISIAPRGKVERGVVPDDDLNLMTIGTSNTWPGGQQMYSENTLQSQINYWRSEVEKERLRADANLGAWKEAKALFEKTNTKYKELLLQYEDSVAVSNQRRIDLAIAKTDLVLEQQNHAETRDSLLSAQRTIQILKKEIKQLTTDLTASQKLNRNLMVVLVILITAILVGALLYWLQANGKIDLKEVVLRRMSTTASDLEVTEV